MGILEKIKATGRGVEDAGVKEDTNGDPWSQKSGANGTAA
jgi:hypothetical protein